MPRPIHLLTIIGTRPEAIKMAPVVIAAAARPGIAHRLVTTGQHDAMCREALAAFGLVADRALPLAANDGSVDGMVRALRDVLKELVREEQPDLVLVQGDTSSAYAAALAAHDARVPIGHVESGLRSGDPDLPWPEERNRTAIDALAALLFAPTEHSRGNLAAEPGVKGEVHFTGNTAIDALLMMREWVGPFVPLPRRLILVTCHRREAIGEGIVQISAALRRIAARGDTHIVLPLHPNPGVRGGFQEALGGAEGIDLVEPLDYPAMVRTMAAAHLILTDSGGIQEEAPALGVPALVLRDVTERPEAVATGNLALVGTDTDTIVAAAGRLLDDAVAHAAMARPAFPYGDGDAASRILDAIERWWAR